MPKAAILAFLASPFVASAAQAPQVEPMYVNLAEIAYVRCHGGSGTAFRVGTYGIVSVNHVTQMEGCLIDGEPAPVTYASPELDFSSLRSVKYQQGLKINCEGFKDKEVYAAVGFARGYPVQRVVLLVASDRLTKVASWKGFYTLYGDESVIGGMSGGPILNRAGEVVGLVNAYNLNFPLSYSRPLSETPLCKH